MTIKIVTVNVTQTVAPAPSQLQRTGAFVSQGGTTLKVGSTQLLTKASDLSSILAGSVVISSMAWASSVVTVTTASAHGIPTGAGVQGIIVGVLPAAYNGTFNITVTGANTFTYPLTPNPGTATLSVSSRFTLEDVQELVAMNATYFAQGSSNSVYVLELGAADEPAGITALTAYINDPAIPMYGYLLPNTWASEATAKTMANTFSSTESEVYFWVNANLTNYTGWKGIKSAIVTVQDSTAPVTECTGAALFYKGLNYNPSNTNKVCPFAFQPVVGVTAFSGTNTQKQLLKDAFVNYVATGVEGGISNTCIFWGVTSDGRDYTYWYAVDWLNINSELALSNRIINGSNNPINPLYYNQAGINDLLATLNAVVNSGISFGILLGPASTSAVPFSTYVVDNPSDYAIGKYAGLSASVTPARGFTQIIFNMNVTDIPLV